MISRRTFVGVCATAPLLLETAQSERVSAQKFALRYGLVWCRGRQLRDGKWRLTVRLYGCRRRTDGGVLFRRFLASPKFVSLLRRRGVATVRSKLQPILIANSAVLPHGPIGFALLLEQIAPLDDQSELFVDPEPNAWG